jgi:CxxC motif-containing protein (DUF1111 family)
MRGAYKVSAVVGLCIIATFATTQTLTRRPNHPPALGSFRFPHPQPQFGDPLPGLTTDQTTNFTIGEAQFQVVDGLPDGLGPIFNNQSCVSCHSVPAVGGSSAIVETRFGKMTNGQFDPLLAEGGTLLHQMGTEIDAQQTIPADANIVTLRKTTPLFGLGLIEAIPDATIMANVHNPAVNGITGKASIITDVGTGQQRVGRFGWKAQQATLLAFSGDAYLNEMGVTSRLFPTDIAPNGNQTLLEKIDPNWNQIQDIPDPVTGKEDIDRFTDFMQLTAPPPTVPLTAQAAIGKVLFTQLDCVACHKPQMTTGQNTITALSFKSVPLYSDLLLHDMGPAGDGIAQSAAGPTEMRTAPLWGLRARAPYLHDGRARTIDSAIRLHDGEALTVRNRYIQMSPQAQQAVLAFLNSI